MIGFWILAALLAAGAGALVMVAAARAPRIAALDPTANVYRRALAEIDDLASRELITAGEHRIARAEAARRLLSASGPVREPPKGASPPLIAAVAALPAIAALALYLTVGSPGYSDQPFSARLAQWQAHPERSQAPELAAALRSLAAQHADDPEPLRRLAGLDLSVGDPDGAVHALRQALRIAPNRVDLMSTLGEVLVLRAAGTVEPDAQALFLRALALDPASDTARYYLARAQIARGDAAGGLANWRALLASLAPEDRRRALLLSDIDAVERTGALPAAAPAQPDPAMGEAIRGMVEGLASRLQAHPDDPQGWVRLVRAYAVLGDIGKRDVALARARSLYANRPAELASLAAAAAPPP